MNHDTFQNLRFYTYILISIVLVFFLLHEGRMLFIPLSFAFLISFILYPICVKLEKFLGRMGGILLSLAMLVALAILLFELLANSFLFLQKKFSNSEDKLMRKISDLVQYLEGYIGFEAENQQDIFKQLYENLLQDIFPLLRETIFLSAMSMTFVLLIPVFVGLILYYRELLVKFVLSIVPERHIDEFKASISEMASTYFQFAKGMLLVYLIVGILNSIGFLAIGLPNAIYLGILRHRPRLFHQ